MKRYQLYKMYAGHVQWKEKMQQSLFASSILITFFVNVPIQLYKTNENEFLISLKSILMYCAITFILSFSFLALIGFLVPKRIAKYYNAILFSIGILMYLQSSFLFLKVGILNGQRYDLSIYQNKILINLFIWVFIPVVCCFLTCKINESFEKTSRFLAIILCALQFLVAILTVMMPNNIYEVSSKEYIVTKNGMNELSQKSNSIMIIMDMFDDTYMTEVLEKNQDIVEELDGFIRYTNCTGKYSSTAYGVPYLITQQLLLNQADTRYGMQEIAYENSSMLRAFRENDYRIQIYTDGNYIGDAIAEDCYNIVDGEEYFISDPLKYAELMIKFTSLRCLPDIFKPKLFISTEMFNEVVSVRNYEIYNSSGISSYLDLMNGPTQTIDKSIFSVIHIRGVHYPYIINENIEEVKDGESTYYQQAVGTMRSVVKFLQHMKDLEIYDNSTIILTADHGYYNGGATTCPAFLIKNKNSHGNMSIDNTAVSHDDIEYFFLHDAKIGTVERDRNAHRTFYTYSLSGFTSQNKFPLEEWYISNESNGPAAFRRSGFYIDTEGNRCLSSKYSLYKFGDIIDFGTGGKSYSYFDYGLGDQSDSLTRIMGNESKLTLSHQKVLSDMVLTIEFLNTQKCDISVSVICDEIECGEVNLLPGQSICQFMIPQGCMNTEKSEIYLRYKNLDMDSLSGAAENLLYKSLSITKYDEKLWLGQDYISTELDDYSARIVSYTFSDDNKLSIKVKNTSSADWLYRDSIKCCLFINGEDNGIRGTLSPNDIIKPNGEVEFYFEGIDYELFQSWRLEGKTIQAGMVHEGFTYFGDIMQIDLD